MFELPATIQSFGISPLDSVIAAVKQFVSQNTF